MRKTIIGAAVLATATLVSYGCLRTAHPSHKPDDQGNAAPIKDVATLNHARDIPLLEPYDAVDHLYRNAKSSLPTSVRLAILDRRTSTPWIRCSQAASQRWWRISFAWLRSQSR